MVVQEKGVKIGIKFISWRIKKAPSKENAKSHGPIQHLERITQYLAADGAKISNLYGKKYNPKSSKDGNFTIFLHTGRDKAYNFERFKESFT